MDDFFAFAIGVADKLIAGSPVSDQEILDLRHGLVLESLADELRRENDAARPPRVVTSRDLIALLDDPRIAAAVNEKGGGRGS